MKEFFWTSTAILLGTASPLAFQVLAQSGGGGSLENPLGEDTIMGVIDNVTAALRDTIAPPIVALAVLYGGFQMLVAGGDPEKFKNGRKTLLYAAVGYAIILVASGITSIISDILSG